MSRNMHAANAAAVEADEVRLIGFFEGEFATGPVRLWTGYGDRVWDDKTWLGGGALLSVSAIEETNGITASGVSVSLSGIPLDMVALAINEARQGAAGRIWFGFCNEQWDLVAPPELLFAGLLDVPQISDDGDSATISISYESQLIDLQRPREWRYTHESQQILVPGDRGFEFVTSIQDINLKWARDR